MAQKKSFGRKGGGGIFENRIYMKLEKKYAVAIKTKTKKLKYKSVFPRCRRGLLPLPFLVVGLLNETKKSEPQIRLNGDSLDPPS